VHSSELSSTAPQALVFGLDPMWFAGTLFVLMYVLIATERINRAVVALVAASLMILSGVLTQQAALHGVDFNTLGLLTGMMVIVSITRKSGVFQFLAVWSAKRVNANPWGILVMLSLVTAVLSALLDNVTTVLLIAPVTLLITEELKVSAYPYLFAEILSSNIGGAATLIGDPPNIMIGSAVGLSFNDFLVHVAPATLIVLPLTLAAIYLIWGRRMTANAEDQKRVMRYNARDAITDTRLLWQSLSVLGLVIFGFVMAHSLNLEPATIAASGAALLLLLDSLPHSASKQAERVHGSFAEVEWVTIFFFIGLFVVVHGLESTGILTLLADQVVETTGGDPGILITVILWVSAVASAVVDNIPFVATMIPIIESMGDELGGAQNLQPLWWALSLGACLGGNGTLIGASANVIVAGFAERAGQPIPFLKFMLTAFPLMLLSILIANVYLYFRYL
jgi:Na+/H+ antiporter NhaD/arsenite permease-like protein